MIDYKRDRDHVVALLAIGAAIANAEEAKSLDLSGIDRHSDARLRLLREFAEAVTCMQNDASTESEKYVAQSVITQFLDGLLITRSSRMTVRQQITEAANLWAIECRAIRWAKKFFASPLLLPRGSRQQIIKQLQKYGFRDNGLLPDGQGRPGTLEEADA